MNEWVAVLFGCENVDDLTPKKLKCPWHHSNVS